MPFKLLPVPAKDLQITDEGMGQKLGSSTEACNQKHDETLKLQERLNIHAEGGQVEQEGMLDIINLEQT